MRAKFLLISTVSVLGLSLMLRTAPAAADDVFVDLSVLDSLGNNNSPVINNGPLFPIVKKAEVRKTPVKVKTKAKPARKAAVNKIAPQKAPAKVTIPPKADVKVEVRTPEVENRRFVDEIVNEPVAAPAVKPADLKDSPFAVAPAETAKEVTAAAPVAPVEIKTEPLEDDNKKPVIMEPLNGATPLPSEAEEPAPQPGAAESMFGASEPAAPAAVDQPVILQRVPEIEPATQVVPLVETIPAQEVQKPVQPVSNEIVFAVDSYELSDDDKANLDKLVASFENPHVNKIAIFAFNVDDGKDVFRKKRLSLNRAIEVRSYLLGKGYKNYSIKVVNLEEANGKENKVMVEELK